MTTRSESKRSVSPPKKVKREERRRRRHKEAEEATSRKEERRSKEPHRQEVVSAELEEEHVEARFDPDISSRALEMIQVELERMEAEKAVREECARKNEAQLPKASALTSIPIEQPILLPKAALTPKWEDVVKAKDDHS